MTVPTPVTRGCFRPETIISPGLIRACSPMTGLNSSTRLISLKVAYSSPTRSRRQQKIRRRAFNARIRLRSGRRLSEGEKPFPRLHQRRRLFQVEPRVGPVHPVRYSREKWTAKGVQGSAPGKDGDRDRSDGPLAGSSPASPIKRAWTCSPTRSARCLLTKICNSSCSARAKTGFSTGSESSSACSGRVGLLRGYDEGSPISWRRGSTCTSCRHVRAVRAQPDVQHALRAIPVVRATGGLDDTLLNGTTGASAETDSNSLKLPRRPCTKRYATSSAALQYAVVEGAPEKRHGVQLLVERRGLEYERCTRRFSRPPERALNPAGRESLGRTNRTPEPRKLYHHLEEDSYVTTTRMVAPGACQDMADHLDEREGHDLACRGWVHRAAYPAALQREKSQRELHPHQRDAHAPGSTPLPLAGRGGAHTPFGALGHHQQVHCRDARQCEEHPVEMGCTLLGEGTREIDPRIARHVSVDEAIEHLHATLREGLIPMTGRVRIDNFIWGVRDRGKLLTICHCCRCCCTILNSGKYLPVSASAALVPLKGVDVRSTVIHCAPVAVPATPHASWGHSMTTNSRCRHGALQGMRALRGRVPVGRREPNI